MTRARGVSMTGYEEKGQMTARSTDVYMPKKGLKEGAVCSGCKAQYRNKRWYPAEEAAKGAKGEVAKHEVTCPACHRVLDNNPAGIVTFSGDYLRTHAKDIHNAIKHVGEQARLKNPLARVMEIKEEGNTMVIGTTDAKLAQKLGREIYKAHHGKLEYQWSRENSFVRVNWSR